MAYITFIARDTYVGSYQLSDAVTIGRGEDCDIFIPDVFVSRHHCRFEESERGWMIVDTDSANGIFFKGARVKRRVLHHEDVLELGSIAFMFDEGDMETPDASTSEPFGPGARIAQLVDTVFAHNARPADYVRKQLKKMPQRKRAAAQEAELDLADVDAVVVAPPEPDEWTELDLEVQLLASDAKPQFILVPIEAASLAAGMDASSLALLATPSQTPVGRWSANGSAQPEPAGAARAASAGVNGSQGNSDLWNQSGKPAAAPEEKKRAIRKPKKEVETELAPLRERLEAAFVSAREWLLENPLRWGGVGGAVAAVVLGVVIYGSIRDPYAGLKARAKERLANMTAQEKADYESASGN